MGGIMKLSRVTPAVVLLAMSATAVGVPSATAMPRGDQPSTKGVIVWTNRASTGSEHLLVARADGSHQRILTPALPDTGDIDAQISPTGP
jgi:hypothetical protein